MFIIYEILGIVKKKLIIFIYTPVVFIFKFLDTTFNFFTITYIVHTFNLKDIRGYFQ